jgi:hypothetical protein
MTKECKDIYKGRCDGAWWCGGKNSVAMLLPEWRENQDPQGKHIFAQMRHEYSHGATNDVLIHNTGHTW